MRQSEHDRIEPGRYRRLAHRPRTGLNVGDRVKVHSDATLEFVIVSIDGEDAVIESVRDDVPGLFPFHARLDRLVPVES